jgi:hypothetical protein
VRARLRGDQGSFAEASHRYSVFYQPTGDGRSTARAGRVARVHATAYFLFKRGFGLIQAPTSKPCQNRSSAPAGAFRALRHFQCVVRRDPARALRLSCRGCPIELEPTT